SRQHRLDSAPPAGCRWILMPIEREVSGYCRALGAFDCLEILFPTKCLRPQQSFLKDRMIVCCARVAEAGRYGARMCGLPGEKISYCSRASNTEGNGSIFGRGEGRSTFETIHPYQRSHYRRQRTTPLSSDGLFDLTGG